jgi:hypothetical protein
MSQELLLSLFLVCYAVVFILHYLACKAYKYLKRIRNRYFPETNVDGDDSGDTSANEATPHSLSAPEDPDELESYYRKSPLLHLIISHGGQPQGSEVSLDGRIPAERHPGKTPTEVGEEQPASPKCDTITPTTSSALSSGASAPFATDSHTEQDDPDAPEQSLFADPSDEGNDESLSQIITEHWLEIILFLPLVVLFILPTMFLKTCVSRGKAKLSAYAYANVENTNDKSDATAIQPDTTGESDSPVPVAPIQAYRQREAVEQGTLPVPATATKKSNQQSERMTYGIEMLSRGLVDYIQSIPQVLDRLLRFLLRATFLIFRRCYVSTISVYAPTFMWIYRQAKNPESRKLWEVAFGLMNAVTAVAYYTCFFDGNGIKVKDWVEILGRKV